MSATASLGKDTSFTAPHIQNSDRRVEKGVYLCLSSLPAPPFHATEQALNTIRANQLPIRAALRELAFRMDDSAVTEALRVLVHPLIHGGTVREHCKKKKEKMRCMAKGRLTANSPLLNWLPQLSPEKIVELIYHFSQAHTITEVVHETSVSHRSCGCLQSLPQGHLLLYGLVHCQDAAGWSQQSRSGR